MMQQYPYQAYTEPRVASPYTPYSSVYSTPGVPQNSLIRVNGMDGARAYQMAPRQTVALFDSSNDYFYIKTTDDAGFPTIRQFSFQEVSATSCTQNTNYVTQDEFKSLKAEIENVKFTLWGTGTNSAGSTNENTVQPSAQ